MLGLFKRLRGSASATADVEPVRLRPRDCHSHVIPGIDDGSRTLEESLAMLRLLASEGAQTVVATSHIYPGRFPNEPDGLRHRFDEVQQAADAAGIPLTLELGAEHYLDETLLPRIHAGNHIAFGPERYVLFEAHTTETAPVDLMPVVRALLDRGDTPLIAHIERYHWLRGEQGWELLEDLRAMGARFQVNRTVGKVNVPGQGARGHFIEKVQRKGWIDEVGSDLHRPTQEGRPYTDAEMQ